MVDPGEAAPAAVRCPPVDVADLLEDGDPVAELARQEVGLAGLPLGEGTVQDAFGGRRSNRATRLTARL